MMAKSTSTACIMSALISEVIAEVVRLCCDVVAAYTICYRKVEIKMAAQNVKILREI